MMDLLVVPRRIGRLSYSALRYPFTVAEGQLVTRRLDDDSAARLSYERFLGSLDRAAGHVLGDEGLVRRGQALSRRADFLEQAERLDAKAEARRTEADRKLSDEQEQSRQARQDAAAERGQRLAAARRQEQQEKEQAKRDQVEMEATAAAEAEQEAQARAAAADEAEGARRQQIADQQERRTQAPRAQRSQATEKRVAARQRRAEADRLDELADTERQSRKSD
jgi:hypothetical protein